MMTTPKTRAPQKPRLRYRPGSPHKPEKPSPEQVSANDPKLLQEADNAEQSDYEVGYCKPPKNARFRRGRSGNPKGRKKGTVNFKTAFAKEAAKKIRVEEGGEVRHLTKQEVSIISLFNNAIKGKPGAVNTLFRLVQLYGDETERNDGPSDLTEEEKEILDRFLRANNRMSSSNEKSKEE